MIVELNARSKEVFRQVVHAFVPPGEPVGSRTIARRLDEQVSPATIRNVMADLEEAGLLYSPHTSAGRLPTEAGVGPFVHGPFGVGHLPAGGRNNNEGVCAPPGQRPAQALGEGNPPPFRPSPFAR